jgi:acetyl-CoA carboxylase, biotin carboxylase subunit
MPKSFRKVLVANRGEIAVRVIRTLHEMQIGAVAVYSEVDRAALHVRMADEAHLIGPAPASESYLLVDRIVDTAKKSGCDAIHPGYGFLSENPLLPEACERAGITFIGPPASCMRQMGSKTAARKRMADAGVPIVPGASCDNTDEAIAAAAKVGFPVMLKASSGGGGKGMRLVEKASDMASAWERARSEAKKFFGDDTVYIEKAILKPRHVEIQVLGDREGNLVHVFERDCSIQRRNQKVVEETPSPAASRELVAKMGAIAVQGAKAVGYFSAGTFEFLLADDGSFYFLEMNTRLQVEHPVTELVSGLDLVREMVLIAQGEKLSFAQGDLMSRGAAIECRIYAEDPDNSFLPSPGRILQLRAPSGPGIRDDSGATAGLDVPIFYDPMISKLIAWAEDRPLAVARMRRALGEYIVAGIRTTVPFFTWLFAQPEFLESRFHTTYLDEVLKARDGRPFVEPSAGDEDLATIAAAIQAALSPAALAVSSAAAGDANAAPARWKARARTEGLC